MASESQHRQKEKSFVHQQPGRFPFGIAIQFPSAAPPSSYEREKKIFFFFFVILFPTHFHFSIWKILTQQLFCVCGMPNQIRRSLISMAGVRATKLDNISWLRRCGDSSDSDNWMCFFFSLSFCWNASENRSNEEEEKQKRTYTKWVEREREKPDFGLCIQKRFPGLGSARLPLQRANAYAVCDGRRRRRSFHYIRTRMSGSTFSHLSYFCKHSWPSSPTDYCWTLDFVLLWYAIS